MHAHRRSIAVVLVRGRRRRGRWRLRARRRSRVRPRPVAGARRRHRRSPRAARPDGRAVRSAPASSADPGATPADAFSVATDDTVVIRAYFYSVASSAVAGLVPLLRDVPGRGHRDRRVERPAGGPSPRRKRRTRDHLGGSGRYPAARASRSRTASRPSTCRANSSLAGDHVDLCPARPGRLHVDPVPDRRDGRGSRSRASRSRSSATRGSCSMGRSGVTSTPTSCRRSSSIVRHTARRSATRPGSTGSANVFEATFLITLLDGSGPTIVEVPAMATCGTGCRGTFDVTLPLRRAGGRWGTLRVWEASARRQPAERARVPGLADAEPIDRGQGTQ